MARYLTAEQVVVLLSARGDNWVNALKDIGLSEEKADTLQRLWVLRIHGRCVHCESERGTSCDCDKKVKVADNRKVETVLSRLPKQEVLMRIPCRKCGEKAPFTVRNALWRISKGTDWDAFFRCRKCLEAGRKARDERRNREKQGKKKKLKPRPAPKPEVKKQDKKLQRHEGELTHRPFAALDAVGAK